MTVFNGEAYLREAIDSILAQSFTDFELIIVDDGSIDRTGDIICSYTDPRISLLINPMNIGVSRSLNRGLSKARGEFIARQDADDISEPERFERQVAFLDAHPKVALLGTWYTEIGGECPRQRILPCDYTAIRWALLFFCPFVQSTVMWRRTPISSHVGGYNESLSYSEDFELWTRVARSFPVANLGENLVRLRLHSESMTMTFGDIALTGHRMRIATVARLLRWRERQISESSYEERYRVLNSLACGTSEVENDMDPLNALDDLLLLQEVFCDESKLPSAEAANHRINLLRHTSNYFNKIAHTIIIKDGDILSATRIYIAASQLKVQAALMRTRRNFMYTPRANS
jgi:glycosyltransferase involved in cell wall biosynthesis